MALLSTVAIWALAVLLMAMGLAGLVLPILPGPVLLLAGLVVAAWAEHFAYVGVGTLSVLALLTAIAHLVDFVAGSFGAKRYGASGRAAIGAMLGAIVGLFFGPLGIVFGPFVGALLGELTLHRNLAAAGRAGYGATIGMIIGAVAKLALGIAMVGIFLFVRFV